MVTVTGMLGREHADDVLQDTFLQIYRKLGLLTEPLAFRAWAYRIATRLALARLKTRAHMETTDS